MLTVFYFKDKFGISLSMLGDGFEGRYNYLVTKLP